MERLMKYRPPTQVEINQWAIEKAREQWLWEQRRELYTYIIGVYRKAGLWFSVPKHLDRTTRKTGGPSKDRDGGWNGSWDNTIKEIENIRT
jgi:hypothetical protein